MNDRAITLKCELAARYDTRASFYGKAVEVHYNDGTIELHSFSTLVATIYSPLNCRSLRLALQHYRAAH